MADVAGHIAVGALFAIPAWFLWNRRPAMLFIGITIVSALFPDSDLYLRKIFPTIHHHGVTHTLLFAIVVSLVGGAIAAVVLTDYLDRNWFPEGTLDRETVFVFCASAFFLGSISHIFADMLSAPDIAPRLEPLWPLVNGQIVTLDLYYYNSPLVNFGLFAVALVIHAVLYWRDGYQITNRYIVNEQSH
ncbi:metal-dependent hydrolase [Haladaptatus salinisoli]|uniref:metal-dependent hydrolase n=1 Tax=Haladaptatus salinisoli TaxID=2884876 RepID=UPI001D0B2FBD|nr:metal-dependent hydrolase [Haladaptatus salinisoli]